MAEKLVIKAESKLDKYKELLPQLQAILVHESDMIANMANLCAALKEAFDWLWVGFYRVEHNELILGPFQGPLACTRIAYGVGVCGTAWKNGQALIVPDVKQFPGHIACSSLSKSEIVLPVFSKTKQIIAVLDIDSVNLAEFDLVDQEFLTKTLEFMF